MFKLYTYKNIKNEIKNIIKDGYIRKNQKTCGCTKNYQYIISLKTRLLPG